MVKLVALLRRREGLTKQEFGRWWVERHAPIAKRLPGLRGYRINLTFDAYAYSKAGEEKLAEAPYDGTAELWFNSVKDMEAAFATPFGQEAGRDADAHTSARVHFYTDEHVMI